MYITLFYDNIFSVFLHYIDIRFESKSDDSWEIVWEEVKEKVTYLYINIKTLREIFTFEWTG